MDALTWRSPDSAGEGHRFTFVCDEILWFLNTFRGANLGLDLLGLHWFW